MRGEIRVNKHSAKLTVLSPSQDQFPVLIGHELDPNASWFVALCGAPAQLRGQWGSKKCFKSPYKSAPFDSSLHWVIPPSRRSTCYIFGLVLEVIFLPIKDICSSTCLIHPLMVLLSLPPMCHAVFMSSTSPCTEARPSFSSVTLTLN